MRWPPCFPCRRRRVSAYEDSTPLSEDFPRDLWTGSVLRRRHRRHIPGSVAFDSLPQMDDSEHHTPQHHTRVPRRGILRNAHRPPLRQAQVPPHLFRDEPWNRPGATPSPTFSEIDRRHGDRPGRVPPHLFADAPAATRRSSTPGPRDAPRPSWDRPGPGAMPSPSFSELEMRFGTSRGGDRPGRVPPHLFRDAPAARPSTPGPRIVPLIPTPEAATFQPPPMAPMPQRAAQDNTTQRHGRVPPHLFRDAPRPSPQHSSGLRSPRLPPHLFRDRHHPYACMCFHRHVSMLMRADTSVQRVHTMLRHPRAARRREGRLWRALLHRWARYSSQPSCLPWCL